ncbi:MAG: ABC transporter substrate-binding protein [Treponema sp.]|nr:ABC transporter substrate-binding protein [Treponema sp.]
MKRIKIIFIILITAFLLVSVFTSCRNKKEAVGRDGLKTVKIGFPSSGSAWPGGIFGAASEYGFLDEYLNKTGYKAELVSFVGAAPAIHEALVAKELDYVVYAGMASVLSKSIGIDHTLISITQWGSGWSFIAGTKSGIDTIHDLRGKKLAYQRGASPHMYFIRVLNEAGLTIDDIEPLNTTIPEGIAGIIAGSIGGSVISSGQEVDLVRDGVVKVIHKGFDADKNVYFEPFVFIARSDVHKANPDVAVAIQKAFLKARDKAKEDVDAYYRLMSDKSGLPLESVLSTAEYDLNVSLPLNLDDFYIASLKDILVFLQDNKMTTGNVDFNAWLDKSVYIRAAREYADEK